MPGKGLNPYGARLLPKGIILPTLVYGGRDIRPDSDDDREDANILE